MGQKQTEFSLEFVCSAAFIYNRMEFWEKIERKGNGASAHSYDDQIITYPREYIIIVWN